MATDPRNLRGDAPLLDAWLRFQETQGHPFTIPGHKHRLDLVGDVIRGDVPLYGGLDTMKLTGNLLLDAQARAAALWSGDRCWFSVGGSTHGNQALALAVGQPGETVIVGRSAHRSVVLGLVLAGLVPHWVCPEVGPTGLPQPIAPHQIEEAFAAVPHAKAVFLGDPSYVGTTGDLTAIAELAHRHDAPLLVDAAWAAHFGFHPDLPANPLRQGADAMVTSAHKTLPAWSQGALIVLRGNRIDQHRLDAAVEATHTTSPAGAFLASIDAARALLERDGEELLAALLSGVARVRARLAEVAGLLVLDGPGVDPVKLTLGLSGTGADGNAIEADLLARGLPLELADRDTLVAMVTLADTPADLDWLAREVAASVEWHRGPARTSAGLAAYRVVPQQVCPPREAFFAPRDAVPIAAAVGRVAAELIAPYPPGIPVIAPGERITAEVVAALEQARAAGARIAYAADHTLATLLVCR